MPKLRRKDPAAVKLGRKGGKAYAKRSPKDLSDAGKHAITARWKAVRTKRLAEGKLDA